MRFQLHLEVLEKNTLISFNYHYALSAAIYKILERADSDYADFLHEKDYSFQGKKFKFFTFSDIRVPKGYWQGMGDRMLIKSRTATLNVSFYMDQAAENFVMGLFKDQIIEIADRKTKGKFLVKQVESLSQDFSSASVQLRPLSPLVVARKNPERRSEDYLHPQDPDFEKFFWDNLVSKFVAVKTFKKEAFDPGIINEKPNLKLFNSHKIKSKLRRIKEGSPSMTQVRGYQGFGLELSAPRELIELGFYAGFGKLNAMGFGMMGVM
ncbi:MAG: CRISPR-associated endoribonuclease Cas6 [Bacteroidota bacterium]